MGSQFKARSCSNRGGKGSVQQLKEGGSIHAHSIRICIRNGDVRIPNRRYTMSCEWTRRQPGCVRVYRDITRRCECGGRVRRYDAGDGGGGIQKVGKTTGSLGGTHTHSMSLASALRSRPCSCPAVAAVRGTCSRGARCEVRGRAAVL